MGDLSYGVEIEHGWGDDEADISELGGVEWLKVSPGMDRTQVVVLSEIGQIVRYWGHWWAPIGEFRRCIVPGKLPDMSCPLCRGRFARQERFVASAWCDGRVWRWEFGPVQRRQIVAAMREAGVVDLRGLALGLWRLKARQPIMVEILGAGEITPPEPLPDAVDLDLLMSQQWTRQAMKFGKASAWSDVEAAHAGPAARPSRTTAPYRQSGPPSSAASAPDSGEAAPHPPPWAVAYRDKHGKWPRGFSP